MGSVALKRMNRRISPITRAELSSMLYSAMRLRATQTSFVQHDHMIEKFSPAASDPPLGESILPWRLNTRPLRIQTGAVQERDHVGIKLRVVIQKHVTYGPVPANASRSCCMTQSAVG
jgi:hypothetical protein